MSSDRKEIDVETSTDMSVLRFPELEPKVWLENDCMLMSLAWLLRGPKGGEKSSLGWVRLG